MSEPSSAKSQANRENAAKSTGPKDTTSTRYNALKHGLLAEGITELDDASGFESMRKRLIAEFQPVGEVETFLVRRIALCIVRLKRSYLIEAEFITSMINPPLREPTPLQVDLDAATEGKLIDPGLPASLPFGAIQILGDKLQRYETGLENKFYRAMLQLERLQRMRRGDHVPAPATVDVGVHSDSPLASHEHSSQPGMPPI
jgi:hypothetical protein